MGDFKIGEKDSPFGRVTDEGLEVEVAPGETMVIPYSDDAITSKAAQGTKDAQSDIVAHAKPSLGPFRFATEATFDKTRALDVSKDDMAKIQRFALRELSADEVAVFTMNLCNDQIDRHASRFPKKELETINRMIRGKPTMVNHDMSQMPRGRFFDSRMAKGPTGPQSISNSKDALFVQPSFYMLREPENESFIRNIEAGIYSGTSIGFSFDTPECSICSCDLRACAHWPGDEYEGVECHYIMHDVRDVFEGSIVPLGSQGTEIVARTEEGQRVLPFGDALKVAREGYRIASEKVDNDDPEDAQLTSKEALAKNVLRISEECRQDRDDYGVIKSDFNTR